MSTAATLLGPARVRRRSVSFNEGKNNVFVIETKERRKELESQLSDSERLQWTRSNQSQRVGGVGREDYWIPPYWIDEYSVPQVAPLTPPSVYDLDRGIVWTWTVILIVFLVILALIAIIAFVVIRTMERQKTFEPVRIKEYKNIRGTFYPLPSGGLLVKYDCDPTRQMVHAQHHKKRVRNILFLHGSTENLDAYADAFECFRPLNYQFWALEYAGYGPTHPETMGRFQAPSADSLIRDVHEAWDICGDTESIVMGFSLGGGLLGEIYESLCPAPAQLVFLNTFASFPRLVGESVPSWASTVVKACISIRWEALAPCSYDGKVLIVYTCDDTSVPPEHGKQLCRVFCNADSKCIELPGGGHQLSLFKHLREWSSHLLPPFYY